MEEKKIKVRILPGHGIGGVGSAGDEVWMSKADAEVYIRDGYVEVVKDDESPSLPELTVTTDPVKTVYDGDITIMKPKAQRIKKKSTGSASL